MIQYLEFKDARCKDCYKCLRECPVKAIKVVDHHAKIIESRCILCGHCTKVCPQNAKSVHSERAEVEKLLAEGKVVARRDTRNPDGRIEDHLERLNTPW